MQGLSQTLQNLGTVRLLSIGGVALGLVLFFVFLSSRLSTPDMALLYADLDQGDSSKIVAKLESMGIPYQLAANGNRIMVPSDQALRLRMTMAQEGLPTGGSIGYEIFDKSESLGTTNFIQNINLLRALEGELARTMRALAPVQEARVHLVMPKRELFSREKQEPRASVFIKERGTDQLAKAQVQAIQHLVAAAVPGLKPSRISVIDSRGRLLARGDGEGTDTGMSAENHDDMRRSHEERLTRIIEELLERNVGNGKVRARVNSEMDFDRVTTNAELYDPNGQVVRSTQTVEDTSRSSDASGKESVTVNSNLPAAQSSATSGNDARTSNQSSRTEETVNYEISKTVRQHIQDSGTVRRISVAVMVDGNYTTGGKGEKTYQPRSQAELDKLASLVRSAIGFDAKRGDVVELVNMQFASYEGEIEKVEPPLFGLTKADYFRIAELLVLSVVGILVLLLVVRPLVTRTLDALPSALNAVREQNLLADQTADGSALSGPGGTGVSAALEEEENDLINIDRIDGQVRRSTLKKIGEIVDKHPEETVAIIRQWLYQET